MLSSKTTHLPSEKQWNETLKIWNAKKNATGNLRWTTTFLASMTVGSSRSCFGKGSCSVGTVNATWTCSVQ